ncbi:MAG: hypothetical protein AB3N13_13965 [Arenibacterium sp.]
MKDIPATEYAISASTTPSPAIKTIVEAMKLNRIAKINTKGAIANLSFECVSAVKTESVNKPCQRGQKIASGYLGRAGLFTPE